MRLHLPDGSHLRIFRLVGQLFGQPIPQPGDGDAHLLHRVAVADGHCVVRLDALFRVANGLKIDGDAVGGADLVLPAIALADGAGELLAQGAAPPP